MKERPVLFSAPMVRAIREGRKTMTRRVMKPQPKPYAGGVHPSHVAIHPAPYIDAYCGERKAPENPRGMSAEWHWWTEDNRLGPRVGRCPYGQPGDRLWVRETFVIEDASEYGLDAADPPSGPVRVEDEGTEFERILIPRYRATEPATLLMDDDGEASTAWRPSIFMPRWASRLTLRIENVRIERVQDLTEADALAEGCEARYGRSSAPMEPEERDGHSAVQEFAALWDHLHAKHPERQWNANPWVWVVVFRVTPSAAAVEAVSSGWREPEEGS